MDRVHADLALLTLCLSRHGGNLRVGNLRPGSLCDAPKWLEIGRDQRWVKYWVSVKLQIDVSNSILHTKGQKWVFTCEGKLANKRSEWANSGVWKLTFAPFVRYFTQHMMRKELLKVFTLCCIVNANCKMNTYMVWRIMICKAILNFCLNFSLLV